MYCRVYYRFLPAFLNVFKHNLLKKNKNIWYHCISLIYFQQDKKYATDKYKDIYTELSIVKAKADCDISKLKEKLLIATEALGERTVDGTVTSGYGNWKMLLWSLWTPL